MNELNELLAMVESIAATRPSYSLPNFLPRAVLELGVLNALEQGDAAGDKLIRELASLSRRASGYGVSYPLLHEMEAAGWIEAYRDGELRRRIYRLTDTGRVQMNELRRVYRTATPEQFQIGLNLIAVHATNPN